MIFDRRRACRKRKRHLPRVKINEASDDPVVSAQSQVRAEPSRLEVMQNVNTAYDELTMEAVIVSRRFNFTAREISVRDRILCLGLRIVHL